MSVAPTPAPAKFDVNDAFRAFGPDALIAALDENAVVVEPAPAAAQVPGAFDAALPLSATATSAKPAAKPETCPWTFEPVFRTREVEKPADIVAGLFGGGSRVILGGAPKKTIKSWTLMALAMAVAAGRPFLGWKTVQSPTVYFSAEEPTWRIRSRLRALAVGMGEAENLDLPLLVASPDDTPRIRLDDAGHLRALEALVKQHKPSLLIMEPLRRLHRADENSSSEISPILDSLTDLVRSTGCALVLAHHVTKGGGTGSASLRGTSDLPSWYDLGLFATRKKDVIEVEVESRDADVPTFGMRLVTEANGKGDLTSARLDKVDIASREKAGESASSDDALRAKIRAALEKQRGPLTRNVLFTKVGGGRGACLAMVKTMLEDGALQPCGSGVELVPAA